MIDFMTNETKVLRDIVASIWRKNHESADD